MTRVLLNDTHCLIQGKDQLLMESRSRPGQFHSLEIVNGLEVCSCEGFQFQRTCWHCDLLRAHRTGHADMRLDVDAA